MTTEGPLQIAIDGPVASGKGDIAARLARQLGLVYIYTGAMYRALAIACLEDGVSFTDVPGVMDVLARHTIDLVKPGEDARRSFAVLLDGVDITERIFAQDAARGASDVGVIAEVRQFMVRRQRELARGEGVVMEGRDIGLRVLPDAQLKIYLTASCEERARRRFIQFEKKGIHKTYEEVLEDTKMRDAQDVGRQTDPLQKVTDAWELDTTKMTPSEVVNRIVEELRVRRLL